MRDYCQHGEPMDEYCPQCAGHTKAAANDSATAPVPAGGTPEGLAREKVEMTDSEVKPSSPTTEAPSRDDFIRAAEERIYAARQSGDVFMATAIRVELLTMWDEGRREAVRRIIERAPKHLHELIRVAGLMEGVSE